MCRAKGQKGSIKDFFRKKIDSEIEIWYGFFLYFERLFFFRPAANKRKASMKRMKRETEKKDKKGIPPIRLSSIELYLEEV